MNNKQIEQIKQFLYGEIIERRDYSASKMCEEVLKFIEQMDNNKKRDLYNDKVEISVLALIEIKRAFGALLDNKESYIHKVFSDDYVFYALDELKKTYAEYFDEPEKKWGRNKWTTITNNTIR